MKKLTHYLLAGLLAVSTLTACSSDTDNANGVSASGTTSTADGVATGTTGQIVVVSREEGSGTRSAFTELIGVLDDDGNDMTSLSAIVHSSTGSAMTEVSNTPNAIGYISLGSLNDTVQALSVDGVAPTVENVLSGDYTVARPFNIATKDEPTGLTADFIGFIMSAEGQAIVEEVGYIPLESQEYTSTAPSGSIVVGGSTSVYPVMERLVEEYLVINPSAKISIEGGGSSTGMNNAIDGTFDIGMASRALKDSEKEVLNYMEIAQDGIVVIANNGNSFSDISTEDIKNIFLGDLTKWEDVG